MAKHRWTDWESHLVNKAQQGERVAFELIIDTHRDTMRQVALRMLRDVEDANDAVQEATLKAYRAIHRFQPGRPVLPWLLRVVSNCCVDIIRQRKVECEDIDKHEYALHDDSADIVAASENKMLDEMVREAINRLPSRYRRIIQMRHYSHMEVTEIAEALNKPEGTIKSWLFRARALLRKELSVALGVPG